MNKQYVKGVKIEKKSFLRLMDSKLAISKLALLFSDQYRDNISTVQRTKTKEREIGFLRLMLYFTGCPMKTSVLQGIQ